MAGIDTLIRGAVGSLAKDKITSQLTPTQMELASFILNPQYYMAEKGINKIAEILGYGSDYRNLSADAKSNKEWYKEVMRDSIGDVLPSSIGDFVRATPRISETNLQPAGEYIAWNPDTQSFETQQSNSPAVVFDQFAGDRFGGKYDQNSVFNTNSQNYVGPVTPSTQNDVYYGNMSELLGMLSPYRTAEVPEMVTTGTKETAPDGYTFDTDTEVMIPSGAGGDFAPIDFGGIMDYSDVFGSGYSDFGGGGGSKGNIEDYSYSQYRYGGQIHRGRR